MPLTEVAIRNLKPTAKDQKVYDSGGLYLLVTRSGSKYWRLKYRIAGKEKKLALGVYPGVSLKEAREKRDEAKKLLAGGTDPNFKKQNDKRLAVFNTANTFKTVAIEWHQTNKRNWTESYGAMVLRRLELNIFPDLGDRPIKDIAPLELLHTLRIVEKRNATHMSHRLLQLCRLVFRYAIVTQRCDYNPAFDLQGALMPHKEKHHPTLKAKELPNFLTSLESVGTTYQNRLAIKILLHTFLRQGELRYSKWEDIHWDAKEWHIPAENMKMREPHVVPLSKQAIILLEDLHRISGHSAYLFPSQQRQKNPVMSENTVNVVIKNMGYGGKIVGHGFRALASTILNEQGFRADVIERQLAHAERNKVRAAYNRAEYMPERVEMMQWWSNYIEEAAKVKPTKSQAAWSSCA